jgi:hypothetical protein
LFCDFINTALQSQPVTMGIHRIATVVATLTVFVREKELSELCKRLYPPRQVAEKSGRSTSATSKGQNFPLATDRFWPIPAACDLLLEFA